jgi:predicted RNA-binding protein with EMAP domain
MVNQSYLTSSDNSEQINETINLLYKKIIDSGKGCHLSNNTTFTKHLQKEVTYLKIILSSMEKEEVDEVKKVVDEVVGEVMEEVVLENKEIPIEPVSGYYCIIS